MNEVFCCNECVSNKHLMKFTYTAYSIKLCNYLTANFWIFFFVYSFLLKPQLLFITAMLFALFSELFKLDGIDMVMVEDGRFFIIMKNSFSSFLNVSLVLP